MAEELSTLRVEMHRGFGELRAELAGLRGDLRTELRTEIAGVRTELHTDISNVRVDVIRWSFLFWVTQLGAMAGLLAYMK